MFLHLRRDGIVNVFVGCFIFRYPEVIRKKSVKISPPGKFVAQTLSPRLLKCVVFAVYSKSGHKWTTEPIEKFPNKTKQCKKAMYHKKLTKGA